MLKSVIALMILALSIHSNTIHDKHIGKSGRKAIDLILPNEKIIQQQYGDLNHDTIKDIALIVERTDKSLIQKKENNGYQKNYNPRILLIAFQDKNGIFTVHTVNAKGFIPSETNSENENFCVDPFISITSKQLLEVNFSTMMSAGGWGATSSKFLFRFQKGKFFLIGSENMEFSRASGAGSNVSINYLTSNKIITTGLIIVGEDEEHPINKKEKIPKAPLIELSKMTDFMNFTEFADY